MNRQYLRGARSFLSKAVPERENLRWDCSRQSRPPSRAKHTAVLRMESAKLRRSAYRLYASFKYVGPNGELKDASREALRAQKLRLHRLQEELTKKMSIHEETWRRNQLVRERRAENFVEMAAGPVGAQAMDGVRSMEDLYAKIDEFEQVLKCATTGTETLRDTQWKIVFLRECGEQIMKEYETHLKETSKTDKAGREDCLAKACETFLEMMLSEQQNELEKLKRMVRVVKRNVEEVEERREREREEIGRIRERIANIESSFQREMDDWEKRTTRRTTRRTQKEVGGVTAKKGRLRTVLGEGRVVKGAGAGRGETEKKTKITTLVGAKKRWNM